MANNYNYTSVIALLILLGSLIMAPLTAAQPPSPPPAPAEINNPVSSEDIHATDTLNLEDRINILESKVEGLESNKMPSFYLISLIILNITLIIILVYVIIKLKNSRAQKSINNPEYYMK